MLMVKGRNGLWSGCIDGWMVLRILDEGVDRLLVAFLEYFLGLNPSIDL
jgi:hypothetical protein